ncbi:MAG: exodeoxyribonuclease VII large subunit [Defluviitaleaceae bacterium]|nr:exodeoxyribonuclease VII large subunit [Defluviitaleaceae bacterium]
MDSLNRKIFTVHQLNQYIKHMLEDDVLLSGIFIEGEISNFKRHTSGHLYFTMKDAHAAVNCVMFRGYAENLGFMPENGMRLVAFGRVSLYEKTGQYQFYAEDMEPWGKGGLYLAFEQMKEKLGKQGLFDRKRPIPGYPETVAVVTSPTGAVVRDIITVARRRNKNVRLLIFPALVQGSGAAASIVSAVETANGMPCPPDVLILARGGGSLEDLWSFNEEAVARAVYASKIPVVSAIGHETDYCITDFVADMRAPTPSAAAEMCIPSASDLRRGLAGASHRLDIAIDQKLENGRRAVERLAERLSPRALLESVYNRQIYVEQLFSKITRDMGHKSQIARLRLEKLMGGIDAVAPAAVLARGYSLVYGKYGLKTAAAQLSAGDEVVIQFHDGKARAEII